jgi:uncharacterized protein YdhG (YjbR/CyaY superfamily)
MSKRPTGSKGKSPKDVEAYLAAVPDVPRATLEKMRKTIRSVSPGLEEVISYQIPAFKYKGRPIVWFAAWKNHCSFYPVIGGFEDELKKYEISKGTIRYPLDKPLPSGLVKKMVKAWMKQVDSK